MTDSDNDFGLIGWCAVALLVLGTGAAMFLW